MIFTFFVELTCGLFDLNQGPINLFLTSTRGIEVV